MEFCSQGELYTRIVKDGPLGEREAARVLHQILAALLYLKRMGICHRDVKPENILFDREGNAKLVDFGFGCSSVSEEDLRKTVCGTPSYTPPEVLMKSGYDPELMDVWGLGVTFYAMLTGELPFEGDNSQKRRDRIANFKWTAKSYFTPKVIKLLGSIFVEAGRRANLQQLLATDFLAGSQFLAGNFVDHRSEMVALEESVLALAEKECRFERRKIIDSVKEYKMDRYHATYYLLLRREMGLGKLCEGKVDPYKKQRRASICKLDPILRTPQPRGKEMMERLNL